MALRKKMRAKLLAMTQETPAALMARGACSRDEPQPKLVVATMMSPGLTRLHEIRVDVLHAVLGQLLRRRTCSGSGPG